jgi:hypothetical protein
MFTELVKLNTTDQNSEEHSERKEMIPFPALLLRLEAAATSYELFPPDSIRRTYLTICSALGPFEPDLQQPVLDGSVVALTSYMEAVSEYMKTRSRFSTRALQVLLKACIQRIQEEASTFFKIHHKNKTSGVWREVAVRIELALASLHADMLDEARRQEEPGESFFLLQGATQLNSTNSGTVYYLERGDESGFILSQKRGLRYLLRGRCEITGASTPGTSADGADAIRLLVWPYEGADPIPVEVSGENARDGKCWKVLSSKVSDIPSTAADYAALYAAVNKMAYLAARSGTIVPKTMTRALGWHEVGGERLWLRTNGAITKDGLLYDAPVEARCPAGWPQRLPDPAEGDLPLPDIADGSVLFDLLGFFQEELCYFPIAALGTGAVLMLPASRKKAGRLDWTLELFGRSGYHKTTFVNHLLGMLYGAGYRYYSPTQVSDGAAKDTILGLNEARSRLVSHLYLDIDYQLHPGMPGYEEQQRRRKDLLVGDGNLAGGGNKLRRDGGLDERSAASGMLCRTGESDPHIYSVPNKNESSDARACTFKLYGNSREHTALRKERSDRLHAMRAHLHKIGILWVQWLASMENNTILQHYERSLQQACQQIEEMRKSMQAVHAHDRTSRQLEDMLIGLSFFAEFLRTADGNEVLDGTAVADSILASIPGLIYDRLAAAEQLALSYIRQRGGITEEAALLSQMRDALRTALTKARAHLQVAGSVLPSQRQLPEGCSLNSVGYSQTSTKNGDWRPGIVHLGYIHKRSQLCLFPEAVYMILKEAIKTCPAEQQCWEVLNRVGALEKGEGKNYLKKVRVLGKGERYLVIKSQWLFGDFSAEAPDEGSEAAECSTESSPPPFPAYWKDCSVAEHPMSTALHNSSMPPADQALWWSATLKQYFEAGETLAFSVKEHTQQVSPRDFPLLLRYAYEQQDIELIKSIALVFGITHLVGHTEQAKVSKEAQSNKRSSASPAQPLNSAAESLPEKEPRVLPPDLETTREMTYIEGRQLFTLSSRAIEILDYWDSLHQTRSGVIIRAPRTDEHKRAAQQLANVGATNEQIKLVKDDMESDSFWRGKLRLRHIAENFANRLALLLSLASQSDLPQSRKERLAGYVPDDTAAPVVPPYSDTGGMRRPTRKKKKEEGVREKAVSS